MKKAILCLLVLAIVSCDKKTTKGVETKPINEFIVKMNFKPNKKINLTLKLDDIKVDEFQKKAITIVEKVNIPNRMESLTANFGDNISNNMKINFGNLTTKVIEIQSISLQYGEKVINISPNEIKNHFTLSKYVSQNKDNKLVTKKVDGKHTPTITLRKKTINSLKQTRK